MKIREDFVSNSSSASFIIYGSTGDVNLLVQKVSEILYDCIIPWDINDLVSIRIRTKNKWFKELFTILSRSDEKCDFEMWYEDWRTHKRIDKDPEEISWDSIEIRMEEFIHLEDYGIANKIDSIYFESKDENSDVCNQKLAKLFKFFNTIGCSPDASISERDFLNPDKDEFYVIMDKYINQKQG